MKRSLLLALLSLGACLGLAILVATETILPVSHRSLTRPRILAYRGWQSVGMHVHAGDRIHIQARGRWMYTPGEYHGPEGHARYAAPSFYPLPGVRGGALIGRIGEDGTPFYVGRGLDWVAREPGLLYLRIDDDLLGDNDGWVMVDVMVEPADAAD